MIPIKVKTTTTDRFTRQDLDAALKAGWTAAILEWQRKILPRHFRLVAVQEYGYQRRTAAYQERKIRRLGHRRPLERSGRLKTEVMNLGTIAISRTPGGTEATLTLSGPEYLGARSNGPDLAAELAARSEGDRRKMARFLEKRVAADLNKPGRKRELR